MKRRISDSLQPPYYALQEAVALFFLLFGSPETRVSVDPFFHSICDMWVLVWSRPLVVAERGCSSVKWVKNGGRSSLLSLPYTLALQGSISTSSPLYFVPSSRIWWLCGLYSLKYEGTSAFLTPARSDQTNQLSEQTTDGAICQDVRCNIKSEKLLNSERCHIDANRFTTYKRVK
jgi:hypothetical protein